MRHCLSKSPTHISSVWEEYDVSVTLWWVKPNVERGRRRRRRRWCPPPPPPIASLWAGLALVQLWIHEDFFTNKQHKKWAFHPGIPVLPSVENYSAESFMSCCRYFGPFRLVRWIASMVSSNVSVHLKNICRIKVPAEFFVGQPSKGEMFDGDRQRASQVQRGVGRSIKWQQEHLLAAAKHQWWRASGGIEEVIHRQHWELHKCPDEMRSWLRDHKLTDWSMNFNEKSDHSLQFVELINRVWLGITKIAMYV